MLIVNKTVKHFSLLFVIKIEQLLISLLSLHSYFALLSSQAKLTSPLNWRNEVQMLLKLVALIATLGLQPPPVSWLPSLEEPRNTIFTTLYNLFLCKYIHFTLLLILYGNGHAVLGYSKYRCEDEYKIYSITHSI